MLFLVSILGVRCWAASAGDARWPWFIMCCKEHCKLLSPPRFRTSRSNTSQDAILKPIRPRKNSLTSSCSNVHADDGLGFSIPPYTESKVAIQRLESNVALWRDIPIPLHHKNLQAKSSERCSALRRPGDSLVSDCPAATPETHQAHL